MWMCIWLLICHVSLITVDLLEGRQAVGMSGYLAADLPPPKSKWRRWVLSQRSPVVVQAVMGIWDIKAMEEKIKCGVRTWFLPSTMCMYVYM